MSFFYQELLSLCCLYDRLEIAWAVRTDDNIFLTDGYLNLFERIMNRFWTAIRLKTIRNAFAREVTYFTLSFNSLFYLHVLLQYTEIRPLQKTRNDDYTIFPFIM